MDGVAATRDKASTSLSPDGSRGWPAELDWRWGDVPPSGTWIPEESYRDFVAWLPLVCVDTLVVRDGRVLLTRRRQEPQAGRWWLQGGRLRKGESLENAALRTATQESGLRLTLCAPLGTFSTVFGNSAHGGVPTHTVNVTFLARTRDGAEPRVDVTHDEFTWWPLTDPIGNPYLDQLFALAKPHLEERSE